MIVIFILHFFCNNCCYYTTISFILLHNISLLLSSLVVVDLLRPISRRVSCAHIRINASFSVIPRVLTRHCFDTSHVDWMIHNPSNSSCQSVSSSSAAWTTIMLFVVFGIVKIQRRDKKRDAWLQFADRGFGLKTNGRQKTGPSMMKSIMSWGLAVKSSYHMFLQRAHDVNLLSTFFLLSGGHFNSSRGR